MDGSDLIFNGEIYLYGVVLSHDWCTYMDGGCFSSQMVREALAEIDGDVTIKVNSGGGDPYEGEAIRAMLQEHPGTVRVVVMGDASSAASLMIMSADTIEMSAGSVMMIHDPSACACGTASELHREGDRLDVLADIYASVYAERSGQTGEEVRALMRNELWMGAQEAIERGFADSILGAASNAEEETAQTAMIASAQANYQSSMSHTLMCANKSKNTASDPAAVNPTGETSQIPAMPAQLQRSINMPPNEPAVTTPAAPTMQANPPTGVNPAPTPAPAPQPAPPPQMTNDEAVSAERERVRTIRAAAAPFMASGDLTQANVDALIDEGVTAADAATRMMATMAQNQPSRTSPAEPRGTRRDETDTRIQGMTEALMRNYDGPGADYRGLTVRRMALEMAGTRRNYNDREAVQAGIMSTTMMGGQHGISDFSFITGEVMNRTLMNEYERRQPNWAGVTGPAMRASDFREMHMARFGGDLQLKPVTENGEYKHAVLEDEAEGLKVQRRGRTVKLTFEAIMNDDMSAFDRIPRNFVISARIMESGMIWSIFRENTRLKSDNKALFHADHGNLAAAGAQISVTSVGAGRKAIWEQRAFGSKDKDDFLSLEPDQLIIPPALETTALQFVGATVPTKDADQNPYKSTLRAITVGNLGASAGGSDSSWYLVSSDMPPIEHAYLEGYEAPTIQIVEGMNPRGVTIDIDHIFGAAPTEFRGSFKNPG